MGMGNDDVVPLVTLRLMAVTLADTFALRTAKTAASLETKTQTVAL